MCMLKMEKCKIIKTNIFKQLYCGEIHLWEETSELFKSYEITEDYLNNCKAFECNFIMAIEMYHQILEDCESIFKCV